jgi:hypothetical protein
MSTPAKSLPDDPSQNWGREVRTVFWTVLGLELAGLFAAGALAWGLFSAFGKGLDRYPLNVVLAVDLLFILISAILAELAEEPTRNYGRGHAARSWALVSFIIAVGTLAPLASHVGKTGRDIFEHGKDTIQVTTILSEILCGAGCGKAYFAIITFLTLLCLFLAGLSVFVLRMTPPAEEPEDKYVFLAYGAFAISVFLFGVYTLLNQEWDFVGPKLPPIGGWVIGLMLLFVFAFCIICAAIVSRTRGTREALDLYRSQRVAQGHEGAREKVLSDARSLSEKTAVSMFAWAGGLALVVLLLVILQHSLPDTERVPQIREMLPSLTTFAYSAGALAIALIVAIALAAFVEGVLEQSESKAPPPPPGKSPNGPVTTTPPEPYLGRHPERTLSWIEQVLLWGRNGLKRVGRVFGQVLLLGWDGLTSVGGILGQVLRLAWKGVEKVAGLIGRVLLRAWNGLKGIGGFLGRYSSSVGTGLSPYFGSWWSPNRRPS